MKKERNANLFSLIFKKRGGGAEASGAAGAGGKNWKVSLM